jgi:hypothetical protein
LLVLNRSEHRPRHLVVITPVVCFRWSGRIGFILDWGTPPVRFEAGLSSGNHQIGIVRPKRLDP